jgi:hypothetical protein
MKRLLLVLFISSSLFATAQTEKPIPNGMETQVKILRLYPNPAISVINFEFQKSFEKGYTLQVYNFVGKKVSETFALTAKTSIPLNEFYRGVYIFQLRDKSGRIVESGKFQVIK